MDSKQLTLLLKKYPLALGCIALALVAGGTYYWRSGTLEDVTAESAVSKAASNKLVTNIQSGARLKDDVPRISNAADTIAKRMAPLADSAAMLQYFYKMESAAGVKMSPPSPGKGVSAKNDSYAIATYAFTVQGSFEQVMLYLGKFETGEYYARLRSASLAQVSGGVGSGDFSRPYILTLQIEIIGNK